MNRLNNKRVCDLNKVQFADFYYRNQYDNTSKIALKHSHRGVPYAPDENAVNWNTAQSVESMEERAVRLRIKDIWTPEVRLTFASNHPIIYTGDKAKSIWKEWNRRIFKKGNR